MVEVLTFQNKNSDRFSTLTADQLNDEEKESLINLAIEIFDERHQPGECVKDPKKTCAFLRLIMSDKIHEEFGVIYLDNKHHVISMEQLFQGSINSASVYPRVVVQRAITTHCACVIFYHNHPSGNPECSEPDKLITKRLIDALNLVEVQVLDHFIVGKFGTFSFVEHGLI